MQKSYKDIENIHIKYYNVNIKDKYYYNHSITIVA